MLLGGCKSMLQKMLKSSSRCIVAPSVSILNAHFRT